MERRHYGTLAEDHKESLEVSSILPEKSDMFYYEDDVNPLSFMLFYWINWLLKVGYNTPLEIKHLGSLPTKHTARYNYTKFRRYFLKELDDAVAASRLPSLAKVYVKVYWYLGFVTFVERVISEVLAITIPLLVDATISNIERREEGLIPEATPHYVTVSDFCGNIYVLAVIFTAVHFIQYLWSHPHTYHCSVIGVHLRSAIQTLVYEKSLRLSNLATSSLTVGEITNHMSTDATSLFYFAQKIHYMWACPVRIIVVLGLLFYYVQISALLGVVSVFLLFPLQTIVVKQSSKHQKDALVQSDERLKKSNEMLNGIKLLKLYGWVDIYLNLMLAVRTKELRSILKFNTQFACTVSLCFALPLVLNIVIFGTYPYLSGQSLTASDAFTVFALINILTDPIYELPSVLSSLVNAMVATKRLRTFFLVPEIEQHNDDQMAMGGNNHGSKDISVTFEPSMKRVSWRPILKEDSSVLSQDRMKTPQETNAYTNPGFQESGIHNFPEKDFDEVDYAIKVSNGSFTWDRENAEPVLKNINVTIPTGKLVMVIGAVGSGKSSLLSAIVGEMSTSQGFVKFRKQNALSVAYTTQRPWIINATLRENILFGKPYQYHKYQRVIDACALKPDLDILPAGDMTEIGEKGINLSAGQKQRVSVARAMYSDKEIILMDDPLSSLDVHVGDHLFTQGIKDMVLEEKRTVILVTHQVQHLKHADLVVAMENGEITDQGKLDDLLKGTARGMIMSDSDSVSEYDEDEERRTRKKQMLQKFSSGNKGKNVKDKSEDDTNSVTGQTIEAEELERGAVSYQVYLYLFTSMGWPIIVAFLLLRILQEIAHLGRQVWLAEWTDATMSLNSTYNTINEDSTDYYVIVYIIISMGVIVGTIMMISTAVTAFYFASGRIHTAMVQSIFRSPIRFFDTTPVGRILNRLSNDMQTVDIKLLVTFTSFIYFFISLPCFLIAIGCIIPVFLAEIVPLLVIYYYLQKYFIRSSRELQRLESITRSPVYAHFSETLGGLSTIRAYGEEERFFNTLLGKIDTNNTAFLYLQAVNSWIGAQLNFLSCGILLMATLTAIISVETSGLSPGYVGLCFLLGNAIAYLLYFVLKHTADTELQMNAVERIRHYSQLVNEDPSGTEPPSNWPHRGCIDIQDIYVRNADDLPPVLESIRLYITPGEKLGICGRTGSGKSSLTLALFRLIDTFKGRILIDGEDIANLPLKTLRQRLSIIPQDPILFSGSIRNDLDPEGKKKDTELWEALETAQLKEVVCKLEEGLDYEVKEGGENFSVGQRQLFCVARAFLRNSKILIMDEATASVDYDTEKVLQRVTSSAFRDKTVITVAHRISTILNSDMIVVLSDGNIVEHDTPDVLLSRDSVFRSLVQANK